MMFLNLQGLFAKNIMLMGKPSGFKVGRKRVNLIIGPKKKTFDYLFS